MFIEEGMIFLKIIKQDETSFYIIFHFLLPTPSRVMFFLKMYFI